MKKLLCLSIVILLLCSSVVPTWAATNEYRSWLQSDPRWGSITFGSNDTMSQSGCAVTAVAKVMVHSGAVSSDSSVSNPGIFCKWMKNNGGLTSQGWMVWSKAAAYTDSFSYHNTASLSGTTTQKTAVIQSYLNKGYVLVAMVKNGGHYVAVDKVENGTVYIMDSIRNSYTRLFDYDPSGVTKLHLFKGSRIQNDQPAKPDPYDTSVQPVGVGTYTITSDNGLYLRSGAGTSYDILTAIPYQTTVKVTKVKNGWGYTSYDGHKGWFTLQFAKLTKNTLRGLSLTPPKTTTYFQGDKLNTTGMTVKALYANGNEKKLTSSQYVISGFSSKKIGTCQVYVTYQTKSAVFSVKISQKPSTPQKKQTGIKVTCNLSYYVLGYTLSQKDFKVFRLYDDNTTKAISNFTVSMGAVQQNTLTVTIIDGKFSKKIKIKMFSKKPIGDCNLDHKVDAADALLILQAAVGKNPKKIPKELADITKNNTIDAADALLVLQTAVGKKQLRS
jgi:uncharacterized protein YgiM (DUF1202 family)